MHGSRRRTRRGRSRAVTHARRRPRQVPWDAPDGPDGGRPELHQGAGPLRPRGNLWAKRQLPAAAPAPSRPWPRTRVTENRAPRALEPTRRACAQLRGRGARGLLLQGQGAGWEPTGPRGLSGREPGEQRRGRSPQRRTGRAGAKGEARPGPRCSRTYRRPGQLLENGKAQETESLSPEGSARNRAC